MPHTVPSLGQRLNRGPCIPCCRRASATVSYPRYNECEALYTVPCSTPGAGDVSIPSALHVLSVTAAGHMRRRTSHSRRRLLPPHARARARARIRDKVGQSGSRALRAWKGT